MKCQHCGSTDIIAIQGQNYCLNCGYAVTTPVAKATPAAAPAAPAAPKKPHGRTKEAARSKTPKAGKLAASQSSVVPSTPAQRQRIQAPESRPDKQQPSTSPVHPLRFSVITALTTAVIGGSVTAAALWLQVDSDIGAYVISATVVGLGVFVSLAHAALLYGRSRNQDGRPAPREYWWMAARSGFMEVVNVQLIAIIAAFVLIGVGIIVWRAISAVNMPEGVIISGVVLGLLNLLLAWALLGVYAAARLATPAVVIGGLSASEAVWLGWHLYRRAGGHLVAAGVEALLGRTLVAAILGVIGYVAVVGFTGSNAVVAAVGGGAAVALILFCICMLTLEVDTKLWLAQYRHLATLCPPAERIRLLTGRVQSHAKS